MNKKTKTLIVVIVILLIGLYTIAGTYSVIINVKEKDGVTEIINEITIKDLLTNDNGTYNNIYYDIKSELDVSEEEGNILINSPSLNKSLKIVLESIVEYKVHDNTDAKLSDDEIYDMIVNSVLEIENISDELKSRIINKSSKYRNDISKYIYDIEVSMLGNNVWNYI